MENGMTASRTGLHKPLRVALWGGIAALLALPVVATLFTSDFGWGPEDFVAAGLMLGLTGLALKLIARVRWNTRAKLVASAGVLALLLIVWAELAVGIFD